MSNVITKSDEIYERAKAVIPGGISGHYGAFVRKSGPKFFSKSEGSRFWDVDGNEYIDLMCAYGPMVLGYNNPVVNEAALAQLRLGNTVSLASPVMVDLAETLVDLVDAVDWALFSKNGGDATSQAALMARAATGRKKVVKIKEGYHGVAAWMQEDRPGTTPADTEHVLEVSWNDVESFQELIDRHPEDIACFISSPYDHTLFRDNELPEDGYWQAIEALCRKNNIVLIIDEVRTGFRINLKGANVEYNFKPDLICFGKAIANGFPLAALTGTDSLKEAAKEVYFTGTQFFNAAPMAAARATLMELQKLDGARAMTDYGIKLNRGLVDIASSHGHNLVVSGIPAMPYYRLEGSPLKTHSAWVDQCVNRGLYLLAVHNNFVSTAHNDEDLKKILDIGDAAFEAIGPPSVHSQKD